MFVLVFSTAIYIRTSFFSLLVNRKNATGIAPLVHERKKKELELPVSSKPTNDPHEMCNEICPETTFVIIVCKILENVWCSLFFYFSNIILIPVVAHER